MLKTDVVVSMPGVQLPGMIKVLTVLQARTERETKDPAKTPQINTTK